jgi:F-type H+-transporting ATPase subunit delta
MQGTSREALRALRELLGREVDGADTAAIGRLSEDLFAVVSLFAGQGSLRRTLADPAMPAERKVELIDRLFTGKISDPALEVVRATGRHRWSEPRDVVDALEAVAVEAALTRAEQDEQLDEVEDQLFRFERILNGEPALRAALTDRNLPADRKRALLDRLLQGKAAPVSQALIERAVLSPRGRTIERVFAEFLALAAQRRSRLIARVTSAVPLSAQQQTALAAALAREFGRDVRLQTVVDPSILGGLAVRIGDEVIDGTVARQLDTAHRTLTGRSTGRSA